MHLVSADQLRLFALQLASPRAQRSDRKLPSRHAKTAPLEPCDVPLNEPRSDMEELLHALGCLVPQERG